MASTSPGYGITIRVEGSPDANPVALATTVFSQIYVAILELTVKPFDIYIDDPAWRKFVQIKKRKVPITI